MGLKDIDVKQLKKFQAILALFKFYGINEEDIKNLKDTINQVSENKKKIDKAIEDTRKNFETQDKINKQNHDNLTALTNNMTIEQKKQFEANKKNDGVHYDDLVEVNDDGNF